MKFFVGQGCLTSYKPLYFGAETDLYPDTRISGTVGWGNCKNFLGSAAIIQVCSQSLSLNLNTRYDSVLL